MRGDVPALPDAVGVTSQRGTTGGGSVLERGDDLSADRMHHFGHHTPPRLDAAQTESNGLAGAHCLGRAERSHTADPAGADPAERAEVFEPHAEQRAELGEEPARAELVVLVDDVAERPGDEQVPPRSTKRSSAAAPSSRSR